MVDIKREDLTLSDWTKGISADEFAWGSYFYSEWISSGYNTKGFELWYRMSKTPLNNRSQWYATAISPTNDYGFMAFTRDWRIETEDYWNWATSWTWDENWWWAIYAFEAWGALGYGYLNWVTYGDTAIWIRQTRIDAIDYKNAYNPNSELLSNTDFSDSWQWWTIWDWWMLLQWWGCSHLSILWLTDPITYDISSWGYWASDHFRVAFKVQWWTSGTLTATIVWNAETSETFSEKKDWWYVANIKWTANTTTLKFTPSSNFNWIIDIVNLHLYNMTYVKSQVADLYNWNNSNKHPAVVWEWDLYVWCKNTVNVINLSDRWSTHKDLVDRNFEIVSITQQAWNLIIWATDWYDSRQYYRNGVDAVATEVIEWKWLIIQWVTWTETLSYVLTTSWRNSGTIEWYEYRLYVVSGYQRNLIASKLYQNRSGDYLESVHYNANKKFDFNDVTSAQSMTIFLDWLFIPGCDWIYKYWSDIPWMRSAWTRPIRYDNWSTNIVLGQRGHYLGIWFRTAWVNYIWNVDNRLYPENWFIVTESIYWDKLSTRKAIEKLKIWYKNLPSTIWNIKIYAIVDDTYFWRFFPTSTPTTRPTAWAIYTIANDTTWRVIDVDTTNGVITFVTEHDGGSYPWIANTTLTKVSGTWDDTITVGYNYDNMCLLKTITSDSQWYGSDFIFWKDFVANYMPYWYKLQFVIELNSNSRYLSPEIYEISIHSDISDTIL